MKVFSIGEPSLQGIKELQVKFTGVVGVSGATIELTVLGCAEGNPFHCTKERTVFLSLKLCLSKQSGVFVCQLFMITDQSIHIILLTLHITTDGITCLKVVLNTTS